MLPGRRARSPPRPACRSASTPRKAAVAAAALDAGARDRERRVGRPRRSRHARRRRRRAAPGSSLMHMQGEPRTMQDDPRYDDVVAEVGDFLVERLDAARAAGHRATTRCAPIPASGSARPPRTTSRCSPRSPSSSTRVGVPVLVGDVAQDVPRPRRSRRAATGERRRRATTARSPPSVWALDHGARDRAGARRRAASARAVALLDASMARRATRRRHDDVRGRWAQGLEPRGFCWIIKDRLAASERPGGFARNHRKVRRQEELIWLDRPRLHAHRSRCSTRRTTCTRTTRPASRTRTCRSVATTSGPTGCRVLYAHARAAGSTIPTERVLDPPRGVRRPAARRARRLPALRRPRRPRARTRSSSIEKITGRQLGSVGARDRRGHRRRGDRRAIAPARARRGADDGHASSSRACASSACTACSPRSRPGRSRSRSTSSSPSTSTPAGESDALDDTVDYSAVCEAVSRVVQRRSATSCSSGSRRASPRCAASTSASPA